METENWVFVDGFAQGRSWQSVTRILRSGAGRVFAQTPRAPTFVASARQLGWHTSHLELEHRLERTTYVGYSQGGRLCLQLALDRPEVVHRLALVSASPGIVDPVERAARHEADELLAQSIERDGVRRFLERWVAQPLFAGLPRDRADVDQRAETNTVEGLTYQLRVLGQGSQPSNWERLGELPMPVLLMVGELDTKYVDIAHPMAAAIPDARVEVVAGAGHACHLEQPEAVAHLLAAW